MAIKTERWDVTEYLNSDEDIRHYIDAAFEDGDPTLIRAALNDVARARGMSALSRETGVSREALYKALGPNGNPTFETLSRVLKAFGLRLSVSA